MNTSGFKLSLDHPEVRTLRAQFDHLKQAAHEAAMRAVQAEKSGKRRFRYWPSRMGQDALDVLLRIYRQAYAVAINAHLAQLDQIDAELARICSDWPRHTFEQLRELPPIAHPTKTGDTA